MSLLRYNDYFSDYYHWSNLLPLAPCSVHLI